MVCQQSGTKGTGELEIEASKEQRSQQEIRLLGNQQGIRELARPQKGSNESESQQ